MMPFCDKTITLYNKFRGEDANGKTTVEWFRHVISSCFWSNAYGKVTVGNVELQTNTIICKIPQSDKYMPYARWSADGIDRSENFTLCPDDIIILGQVDDEIGTDITAGQLKNKYATSGALTVITAIDNTGRPLPHYAATGV